MKVKVLTSIFLFGCFFVQLKAQKAYISSNIGGSYTISAIFEHPDSLTNSQTIELTNENRYALVSFVRDVEIVSDQNEHTARYEIRNYRPMENDTINLIFYEFHAVDTTYFASGCLNGTYPESKVTIEEFNKDKPEIEALPDSIVITISSRNLVFKKSILETIEIHHGHGLKNGEKWGFSENTACRQVIYICDAGMK